MLVVSEKLNLRSGPSTSERRLRLLLAGEKVEQLGCEAVTGGLTWLQVKTATDGLVGWAVADYLITPLPPIVPNVRMKAVGVHVAGSGDIGDLLGVAKRLHEAGTPIPLIVVVSDPGLCKRIKDVSPATVVVYRWVASSEDSGPFDNLHADGSGTVGDGAAWFDVLWARHSQAIGADFHQMYNECSFGGNGQNAVYARRVATFELELMKRADAVGVKVTFGNFMPGVPEQRHIDEMRNVLTYAEQHGHALCYHAYSAVTSDATFLHDVNWYALRWVPFVKDFPNLKVILGEAGHYNSPRFRGRDDMLRMMAELEGLLMPLRHSGRDVRAAYWTIRGNKDRTWAVDDWTPYLADYEAWMKG